MTKSYFALQPRRIICNMHTRVLELTSPFDPQVPGASLFRGPQPDVESCIQTHLKNLTPKTSRIVVRRQRGLCIININSGCEGKVFFSFFPPQIHLTIVIGLFRRFRVYKFRKDEWGAWGVLYYYI